MRHSLCCGLSPSFGRRFEERNTTPEVFKFLARYFFHRHIVTHTFRRRVFFESDKVRVVGLI